MQGVCIDPGSSTVLIKDHKYFLFDHGQNNFYVSKFDNVRSHFGSFRRSHFKLVDDPPIDHPGELLDDGRVIYFFADPEQEPVIEQPQRPAITLQRYVGQVKRQRNGFYIGDLYIVTEKGPNGYYHVYLKDRPNGAPIGSYVTNFFEKIADYDDIEISTRDKGTERPKLEAQPITVAITLPEAAEPKNEPKTEGKKAKKNKTSVADGQMDIFEFLEG